MWPAIAAIAGSVISGAMQSSASGKAADNAADASAQAAQIQAAAQREAIASQERLAREAMGLQSGVYAGQLATQQPFYTAGTNALSQLASLYGAYQPSMQQAPMTTQTTRTFTPSAQPQQATSAPQIFSGGAGLGGVLYDSPQSAYDAQWNALKAEGDAMNASMPLGQALLAQARNAQPIFQQAQGTPSNFSGNMTGNAGGTWSETTEQVPTSYSLIPGTNAPTGMAGFYSSPEYGLNQAALRNAIERGSLGLDRAAAASGGVLSGAQSKALSDYSRGQNENYLIGAYGEYANRLAMLAGIGQTAGGNQMSASSSLGTSQGNILSSLGNSTAGLLSGIGDAQAGGLYSSAAAYGAGQLGSANAWGNALSGITGAINNYDWSKFGGGGSSPTGASAGASGGLGAGVNYSGSPFLQGSQF